MRRRQIQPKRGHSPRAHVLGRLQEAKPAWERPAEEEHSQLIGRLKSSRYSAKYLSAAFRESPETFLAALRDVAEAQKGLGKVAVEAGVNRENLYRSLSDEGNPRLSTLWAVLKSVGMRVSLEPVRLDQR